MMTKHDTDNGPCERGAWHEKKKTIHIISYQYYDDWRIEKAFHKKSDALAYLEKRKREEKKNLYIEEIEIE